MRGNVGRKLLLALLGLFAAPADAAESAVSVRLLRSGTVVEPTGTAVQTSHVEIAVNNDAAARSEAQQAFFYADDMEQVELLEGYTIKPDGRRLPVLPGAIRVQLAPGTPNIPEYTNRKQVVAVMPDVAGGDVLSLTWRRTIRTPVFQGHYAATTLFTRNIARDDAEVSISVPAGMVLNTESYGPEHTEADENGRHVHRWRWSAPALASDPAVLSPLDRAPRIFASTFQDWPAFSRTYAALFASKTEVTPPIQALADQVAAGAADKREEAQRLYEWVSRRVRWVAIYVGDGGWVPHTADHVLANHYGDCKDQVALLVALLRARGIEARPVLINLNPTYTLSGPPTLSAFNHMVTYLPGWDLYADTTAGGAPFGTLPMQEYGKPILHVTAEGAAPARMVTLPPDIASERLHTTMTLDGDSRVTGSSTTEATGPYATVLRGVGNRSMARGAERFASEQLRFLNQPGTGEVTPAPLDAVGPEYGISARFTLDAQPGWLEGDGFTVPTGMRLLPRPGDGLLGPLGVRNLPVTEPTPCYAGRQEEDLTLTLPPGYHPVRLPRARKIEDEAFSYDSQWSLEGSKLHVVRRLVSRIGQPLCEGPLRNAAARALEEIRRDQAVQITLEKEG
ncbi:MAG TPA: DUF3857 domain-containing protein [Acetobacteraceae bacterium]